MVWLINTSISFTLITVSFHVCTALVPGEIQNLKRSVDKKQASMTLSWDPPLNFQRRGEVTNYQIRFKPIKGSVDYTEWTVDVSTTSIILRRDSGLKASTMYSFEVRAGNAVSAGVWRKVTACTSKCAFICMHELVSVNNQQRLAFNLYIQPYILIQFETCQQLLMQIFQL